MKSNFLEAFFGPKVCSRVVKDVPRAIQLQVAGDLVSECIDERVRF